MRSVGRAISSYRVCVNPFKIANRFFWCYDVPSRASYRKRNAGEKFSTTRRRLPELRAKNLLAPLVLLCWQIMSQSQAAQWQTLPHCCCMVVHSGRLSATSSQCSTHLVRCLLRARHVHEHIPPRSSIMPLPRHSLTLIFFSVFAMNCAPDTWPQCVPAATALQQPECSSPERLLAHAVENLHDGWHEVGSSCRRRRRVARTAPPLHAPRTAAVLPPQLSRPRSRRLASSTPLPSAPPRGRP